MVSTPNKHKAPPVDEGIVVDKPDDFVLQPGEMVGDYRVDYVLGQGGMGTVYKVTQPIIGKSAALKVIHRSLVASNSAAERLIQEARAVNAIGHDNIVDIFAFGSLPDGRPYLVMEFLEGVGLDSMLTGTIDFPLVCRIGRQICGALDAAHKAGVIHRDLKPENIFIQQARNKTRIKLLDFGIAKVTGDQQVENLKTDTGFVMGTPQYIAPEQAKGRRVGPSADVYSLGVMLFELITGRLPFVAESSIEVAYMHIRDPAPDPRTLRPDIPAALAALLLRMLEKSPDERPSLAEIDVGLRVVLEDPACASGVKTPIPTGKQEPVTPAPDTVKDRIAKTEFVRADELRGGKRDRRPGVIVPALVTGALVLAGLAFFLTREGRGEKSAKGPAPGVAATVATDAPALGPPSEGEKSPPGIEEKEVADASDLPSLGKVELRFNVDSGTAAIGGREYPFVGGQLRIELAAGEHLFEVRAKGHSPYQGQLVAAAEGTVKLGINLKKSDNNTKAKTKPRKVKARRNTKARPRKTRQKPRKREGRDDSINPFE